MRHLMACALLGMSGRWCPTEEVGRCAPASPAGEGSLADMADTPITEGCVVCGPGPSRLEYSIDEGMHRTGEHFKYFQCVGCGSMQIAEVPEHLASYYDPKEYYSFSQTDSKSDRKWLRSTPARIALRANTELFLRTGRGRGVDFTRQLGFRTSDRILDLGCGAGQLLKRLHLFGFRYLMGADPHLDEEREVVPGVQLVKRSHAEIAGEYDWVMMHHAFEHVPDPRATLQSVRRLLAPGGRMLIRMPIMGQHAWRHYGTNWAQLDAPRHLVIYSVPAVRLLAESERFEIDNLYFDSTEFQFWGSELVAAKKPHSTGPEGFSAADRRLWALTAERLNRAGDGDQAVIVLRPS
jgi:SAM-dependent methyltransferase